MNVKIEGLSEVKSYINQLKREEIPKAFRTTINKTLDDIKPAIQTEIKSVFDRPTKWAINSLWIAYLSPTKKQYDGSIRLKDNESLRPGIASGTPAVNFLGPHVIGGSRHHKSHEKWMIRRGLLKSNQHIVPGPHAKFDRYGNQSKAEIIQILSALGAWTSAGFDANSKTGVIKGWKYFISDDGRTVFKVKKQQVKLLWFIVDSVNYKKRFDYFGVGMAEAKNRLMINAKYAVDRAIIKR